MKALNGDVEAINIADPTAVFSTASAAASESSVALKGGAKC